MQSQEIKTFSNKTFARSEIAWSVGVGQKSLQLHSILYAHTQTHTQSQYKNNGTDKHPQHIWKRNAHTHDRAMHKFSISLHLIWFRVRWYV